MSYPTLCPYIFYQDLEAAMAFLEKAFGFRERMRTTNADGSLGHCEMQFGDAVIMMGTPPDFKTPAQLGNVTVGMYVHVDDVEEHHRRAVAADADVDSAPTDQDYGVRSYGARDPEGHQWWFSQPLEGS